jgi:hypothetical protein
MQLGSGYVCWFPQLFWADSGRVLIMPRVYQSHTPVYYLDSRVVLAGVTNHIKNYSFVKHYVLNACPGVEVQLVAFTRDE